MPVEQSHSALCHSQHGQPSSRHSLSITLASLLSSHLHIYHLNTLRPIHLTSVLLSLEKKKNLDQFSGKTSDSLQKLTVELASRCVLSTSVLAQSSTGGRNNTYQLDPEKKRPTSKGWCKKKLTSMTCSLREIGPSVRNHSGRNVEYYKKSVAKSLY